MALTAISEEAEADTGDICPDWYRWLSPSGRWYAARTAPLTTPGSGAMIVSAETYGGLLTAVLHSSPTSAGA